MSTLEIHIIKLDGKCPPVKEKFTFFGQFLKKRSLCLRRVRTPVRENAVEMLFVGLRALFEHLTNERIDFKFLTAFFGSGSDLFDNPLTAIEL